MKNSNQCSLLTKTPRILFPVDFSSRCVLAARHVKAWTDGSNAALSTLHVVDPKALGYSPERNDGSMYHDLANLIAKRTADLKHFSDHYFGENVARHTILSGDAADQIEHFAKHENVDLIMLPRAHQSIVSRLLRDSLTARILHRSAASVWITEHVEAADKLSINSILCAVHFERDLTLEAQNYRILQKVLTLAKAFQAKVTFLTVIDGREEDTTRRPANASLSSGIGPWLTRAHEQLGNGAEFLRQTGDVVSAITDAANRVAADLVVVGRTRPGTIGLGRQSRILKIDDAVHRPILSVW
ncbi:universal stress protein [Alloacidobacterium dinghuense]|uniref:Universal stress protein n=1 Tax=Alloacidobacterium dinghuense TaxID=2763107 RepID=A0A7G8BNY1_9BACT|nr:universal stress protein [Alloacidobacterium dinghuense]QNI34251.1 universal stress protein [Alloacidobacterium dinghuense]